MSKDSHWEFRNRQLDEPDKEKPVRCCRCGNVYPMGDMKWDDAAETFVCRNNPACPGRGFGDMSETNPSPPPGRDPKQGKG